MDLDEYQNTALTFAAYTQSDYPFLALGEEAGEVLGKLAKYNRKHNCPTHIAINRTKPAQLGIARSVENDLHDDLVKELGDVLWQLSACAHELGVDLSLVAKRNLAKLGSRAARGTIVGEGDDR